MSVACEIEVESPVFGTPDQQLPLPTVRFWSVANRITTRELIALTVEAQIHQMLDEHSEVPGSAALRIAKHYLSAKEIKEQTLTGKISVPTINPAPRGVDVAAAIARAQLAFEKGIFKIVIEGRVVGSLDEIVPLAPKMPATFIRLMPLVGG